MFDIMYLTIYYPNYQIISLLTQPRGNCMNVLWLKNYSFHFGTWTRILTTATQGVTILLNLYIFTNKRKNKNILAVIRKNMVIIWEGKKIRNKEAGFWKEISNKELCYKIKQKYLFRNVYFIIIFLGKKDGKVSNTALDKKWRVEYGQTLVF